MNVIKKLQQRNYFLVVKVRPRRSFSIIIPVPLGMVEDFLEALLQLDKISRIFISAERIQKWNRSTKEWSRRYDTKKTTWTWKWRSKDIDYRVDPRKIIDLALEMVRELRRQGRFTLVEVKDREANVSIKLY